MELTQPGACTCESPVACGGRGGEDRGGCDRDARDRGVEGPAPAAAGATGAGHEGLLGGGALTRLCASAVRRAVWGGWAARYRAYRHCATYTPARYTG